MNDVLKKGLTLMIITSIAAVLLGVVYRNTKSRIDAHVRMELEKAYKDVLPGAVEFEEFCLEGGKCFVGCDENKRQVGLAIQLYAQGYGGGIRMVMGIDMAGRICGLKILKQSETPGLGAKISEPWFTAQFGGLKAEDLALKKDTPSGKIDAITAATISSRAVVRGVREGVSVHDSYMTSFRKRDVLRYMPDGTYRGESEGFAGEVSVDIVIANHRITEIKVVRQQESEKQWLSVKERIPREIVKKQSTEVDAVTGATVTSRALINAVQSALDSFGRKR